VKGLVVAMLCGGAVGLSLGVPGIDRAALLAEARSARASDLQVRDLKRSLAAAERLIDYDKNDLEALSVWAQLRRQLSCRRSFEGGEHAFANRDYIAAVTAFRDVGADCDLYDFAQRRLEEIELDWGLTNHPYSAGANVSLMR